MQIGEFKKDYKCNLLNFRDNIRRFLCIISVKLSKLAVGLLSTYFQFMNEHKIHKSQPCKNYWKHIIYLQNQYTSAATRGSTWILPQMLVNVFEIIISQLFTHYSVHSQITFVERFALEHRYVCILCTGAHMCSLVLIRQKMF